MELHPPIPVAVALAVEGEGGRGYGRIQVRNEGKHIKGPRVLLAGIQVMTVGL